MENYCLTKVNYASCILRGSTSDISDLAWSPDNSFIISACLDNTARIFSIQERKLKRVDA